MDNYIKDNPGSSMIKYYKNINNLMGRYIITKVDRPTMMKLLLQLDYYKYETGYAIAMKDYYCMLIYIEIRS